MSAPRPEGMTLDERLDAAYWDVAPRYVLDDDLVMWNCPKEPTP